MAEDIKKFIEESAKETRRHFDVVAENLSSKIQTVAEGVMTHGERLDRVEDRTEKIGKDLTQVKDDTKPSRKL